MPWRTMRPVCATVPTSCPDSSVTGAPSVVFARKITARPPSLGLELEPHDSTHVGAVCCALAFSTMLYGLASFLLHSVLLLITHCKCRNCIYVARRHFRIVFIVLRSHRYVDLLGVTGCDDERSGRCTESNRVRSLQYLNANTRGHTRTRLIRQHTRCL